jgi:ornithine cyclodeaminase
MPEIRILTEKELRKTVSLDLNAIEVVADAFRELANGDAVMPPILRMDLEENNGEVDVKTAWLKNFPDFAIKVSPGFFDNPAKGLPSVNGMMTLFSATTGIARAVLLDNGYLTDVRTAAAGAVSVRELSREDSEILAVIGSGVQARLQAEAICLVRPIRKVLVWGREPERALACAGEIRHVTGVEAQACASPDDAARRADIIVTTTPSRDPVLKRDWLSAGQHVTAMGSDAEHKNELEPAILIAADRFVADSRAQSARLGELNHAIRAGLAGDDFPVSELGAILTGEAVGRQKDDDLTVCCLSGTGAQDTAIACHAVAIAEKAGTGTVITA